VLLAVDREERIKNACKNIDGASSTILCKDPNCVEIDCHGEDSRVVVVGDIHDLLYVPPRISYMSSMGTIYVDKGAWGLEVFLLLLAWKDFMPHRVYLLRGNHESK
jgi:serine/threonine-protein phosphatase 5